MYVVVDIRNTPIKGIKSNKKKELEAITIKKLIEPIRKKMPRYGTEKLHLDIKDDLAKKEEEEISIIEKFLPAQMSETELKEELKKIIEQVGASSPADMGKVMGVATKQLAGKADGKAISIAVKDLLAK